MINWRASKSDARTIGDIVQRAMPMAQQAGIEADATELSMDLTACHLNGCPLDLAQLLAFPDFDFAHDVFGIRRHIDRKTGQLQDCFLPRCALPGPAAPAIGDDVILQSDAGLISRRRAE